eukprot:3936235-Rhodomonas_salina.3
MFEGRVKIHCCFHTAYFGDDLKEKILECMDRVMKDNPAYLLYTTGHSLCSALSTICAVRLAQRSPAQQVAPVLPHCRFIRNAMSGTDISPAISDEEHQLRIATNRKQIFSSCAAHAVRLLQANLAGKDLVSTPFCLITA